MFDISRGGGAVARKKLETLSEQMYYVLLALCAGPMHGYRIMQYVGGLTQGQVVIGAGTLYALLARFEDEGCICLSSTQEGRKYYELTPAGRQVLEHEFDRLRRQVADGASLLQKGDAQ